MDWTAFFIQLFAELGGLTAIAIAGLKFFGNAIVDGLSKRYDQKLNEKLESHKNHLENKSYVSKTKFDANFQIFGEISERLIFCFDLIKKITPENGTKLDNCMDSDELMNAIDEYKKIISRNMPIISESLYDQLINVYNVFYQQVSNYDKVLSDVEDDEEINYYSIDDLLKVEKDIYSALRQYYDKLEVTSD